MKLLMIGILSLSSAAVSAQSLTKQNLASLLTERKATLEAVHAGMSKKIETTSGFLSETGKRCDFKQTSIQTILKVEGDKLIVLSDENFAPVASAGCTEAGLEAFQEKVLFYEAKPTLAADLEDLNQANVNSISRAGNIVTMVVNGQAEGGAVELVTVKYDLTKSSFRNLISTESKDYRSLSTDLADVDVKKVDLKNVVFCASNSPDEQDCSQGDYSDILR